MYNFTRHQQTPFYVSSDPGSNFFAFYLPESDPWPDAISYNDSWFTYAGLYLSLKNAPNDQLLAKLLTLLQQRFPAGSLPHSSLVWVSVSADNVPELLQCMLPEKTLDESLALSENFTLEVLNSFFLLPVAATVLPDLNELDELIGLVIEYPLDPLSMQPQAGKRINIPFTGVQRNCIRAEIAMDESASNGATFPQRGFYTFISKPDSPDIYQGCFYPLYAATQGSEGQQVYTGYHMSFDPLDPFNGQRTRYVTAGYSYQLNKIPEPPFMQVQTVVGAGLGRSSNYLSVFGTGVTLIPLATGTNPASYVQCALPAGSGFPYYLAPEGDFQIGTESAGANFGCGLSGTEYFRLDASETTLLRFESGKPACVKSFPFELASPVGAPSDSLASPFSGDYLTSWATLVAAPDTLLYFSQPGGASLYGKDQSNTVPLGLLTPAELPFSFTADDTSFFPLFPYAGLLTASGAGAMSATDITSLEATVLSTQRRKIVSQLSGTKAHLLSSGEVVGETHFSATPAGLLATTVQNTEHAAIQWSQFLLGKNGADEIAFNNPPDPVITAMQSSDVFLVVSNAANLTAPLSPGDFTNSVTLGGWTLSANIGSDQSYGDYRNIMIFKGRKGKLYDGKDVGNCLVANPKKWSQAADFSIPKTSDGTGDSSQLVILSNWLQDYFEDACNQSSDYFSKFKSIANDENWTGVLFLRVDIAGMPDNLSGIAAGVSNPAAFNAHHLGIDVSPVDVDDTGVPKLDKPSSFFGLIYYLDPGFTDTPPVKTIAPSTSNTYDFKLLSLKVLFDNSAVKGFESYAQLTLNSLFGSSVSKTYISDNVYKNVLLTGQMQINNGQSVYSLKSGTDDAFYLDSNVINKVEITGAILTSRTQASDENQRSWFGLTGFVDFRILKDKNGDAFDLFSFGNIDGQDDLRAGLYFSNLGIAMDFTKSNPSQNTLSFAGDEIRFNPSPAVSTPRDTSIYSQLHLGVDSLVAGATGKSPKDLGYLSMVPDIALSGPGNTGWFALRYKLNMGTPGALAGNIGLNSYLLLSWSPLSKGDTYQAGIDISLPGAGGGKLLSLQTVLTLSIGQIRLTQVGVEGNKAFMLLFTEIALKFLGMLKLPPSGNTLFYLFGTSQSGDQKGSLGWYAMYKKADQQKSLLM